MNHAYTKKILFLTVIAFSLLTTVGCSDLNEKARVIISANGLSEHSIPDPRFALVSDVTDIMVWVEGEGVDTMPTYVDMNTMTAVLEVNSGSARTFKALAFDASYTPIFMDDPAKPATIDLEAGQTADVTVHMIQMPGAGPQVESITPTEGATGVALSPAQIVLTFSEEMDVSTIRNEGVSCGGSVLVSSDTFSTCMMITQVKAHTPSLNSYTLVFTSAFTEGSTYNVIVTPEVLTLANGESLATSFISSFSTEGIPKVNFEYNASSYDENAGTVSVTIQLTAPITVDVTVPITVNGSSTATMSTDYNFSTSLVTIPRGTTSENISIQIVNDPDTESDEIIILDIGTPTNANQGSVLTHVLTIQDDDIPAAQVSFMSSTVNCSHGAGTCSVSVAISQLIPATVTVPVIITGGTAILDTDYTTPPPTVIINPSSPEANFDIPLIYQMTTVTIFLQLGAPSGGGATLGSPSTCTVNLTYP